MMVNEDEERLIVVTGASRGIGYSAAKALAAHGAHVVAIARTVGGLEELDDEIRQAGGTATLVPLDLTDGDGIDRLGAALNDRWGRCDGLVACAAIMPSVSPVGHFKTKEWDEAIGVNLTANWRLLRTLDPLFQKSTAPRVLALTTDYAREISPFMSAYGASKAALEHLVLTYAAETKHTGKFAVNLLSPHPVRSALRHRIKPGENGDLLPSAASIAPKILEMMAPTFTHTGLCVELPPPSGKA